MCWDILRQILILVNCVATHDVIITSTQTVNDRAVCMMITISFAYKGRKEAVALSKFSSDMPKNSQRFTFQWVSIQIQ